MDARYQSPWEDVWIRWREKRKRKYAGTTLMGMKSLEFDLRCYTETETEYEGKDDDAKETQKLIERVKWHRIWHDVDGPTDVPDIYTSDDYITRAIAERMIAFYLGEDHGHLKFRWKRPAIMVVPVGG